MPTDSYDRTFSDYVNSFEQLPISRLRILKVLHSLPEKVQNDFLSDANFRISVDEFEPGKGRTVMMPDLGPNGTSRCVVLKPRLEKCSEKFACYIIAHEFAHAFLHNGGWGKIKDPEFAADALAKSWGYAKQPYERVE